MKDSSSGESFNFGSLNGVRGFFTDPSKADDSFVPFKSSTNCTITLKMPWHSSYSMYGTITVTIKIVNGIVTSVTSPGRIQIASDGNWIEMINNSANLIDN